MEEYYKYPNSYSCSFREAAQKSILLDAKMAELEQTKQELKQAKDAAMQSWLDSRPLIDELEKLQTGLESAKARSGVTDDVIRELKSELADSHRLIKAKTEDEVKKIETIEELTKTSEKLREETERFKLETDEERRARSKLKQVLRLRQQTLRTVQLTLRAVRLESDAYAASAAEALHNINRSEMENTAVSIPEDNYRSLARRANEETSLAEWRISVSMEQKLAAQESRDLVLRASRKKKTINEIHEVKEDDPITTSGAHVSPRGTTEEKQRFPRQVRRAKSNNNSRKRVVKKKKPSIFDQIRTFLVQKITKLFG